MKNSILLTLLIVTGNKFQSVIDLLLSFTKSKGVQFVGIRNYTNSSGEVADVTINVGASYDNAKAKDLEMLKNLDVKTLVSKFNAATLEVARKALIGSLVSPSKAQSEGQKNAYTHIANGLKLHNETGKLFVWGFVHTKKVKVEGEYKKVNSSEETLAKKELQKLMKSTQYRQYVIENIGSVKMNGETLEF